MPLFWNILELEFYVKYSSSWNSSSIYIFSRNSSSWDSSTLHGTRVSWTRVPKFFILFILIFGFAITRLSKYRVLNLRETAPPARFIELLGQTQVNGWSCVIASQNGGSTSYISPLRLRVLQWSRYLFNYWKNKKTMIEKFLILLIWNWIYIDHRKLHGFGPRYNLR